MRIKLYCYESEHSDTSIQACNQLGTPGGAKSFLGGAKFFELCPVVLNDVQHIFPGGSKIFLGGVLTPLSLPWLRPCFDILSETGFQVRPRTFARLESSHTLPVSSRFAVFSECSPIMRSGLNGLLTGFADIC